MTTDEQRSVLALTPCPRCRG